MRFQNASEGLNAVAKILVTGATGFIGSHLIERLLKEGYEVWALVRSRKPLPESVNMIYGDLTGGDLPPLRGFDHVFHLAALTRALVPSDYYKVNFLGTKSLVERLLRDGGLKGRFVFLSSLSAQGPAFGSRPCTEEDVPRPVSPYGKSKLEAETFLKGISDELDVLIVRPSIVYGPRDTYMLEFFRLIKKGFLPLIREDQRLSLCYVADLVEALVLGLSIKVTSGEVVLISDGEIYPLRYIADMVALILGVKYRVIKVPLTVAKTVALVNELWGRMTKRPPAFGINKFMEARQEAWICDITKAKAILGFRPRYTLKEGLEGTLNWYLENGWL